MIRKQIALAIALIFVLSAVPSAFALPAGVVSPAQADLHGPRVNKVLFSVISSDATLYNSLAAGTIQGPEWVFLAGTYATAAQNPELYTNSTLGYTFDGIGFNMLRPVTNTTDFRRAMEYLTDYDFIQTTVLSGVGGLAGPDLMPCTVFPTSCPSSFQTFPFSLTSAVHELKLAGLTEGNTTDVALSSITWLYKGQPFEPKFYYRSDDPLRTGVATSLVHDAASIGLVINAIGTSGSGAFGKVYGPSIAAVITPGVYNPATGGNTAPVFNYTAAGPSGPDTWDMYTFGWIASADFVFQGEIFNSQFTASTVNFLDYYNTTVDKDSNAILYAPTAAAANAAGAKVAQDAGSQVPYLMSFFENQLFSVYINGWAGYVNCVATGPVETYGLYWTLMNVHPAGQASGGTFNYAVHEISDAGGMNPLYNTNWVWQVDIWSEIYDTPLAIGPTQTTTPVAYIDWMTTSHSVAPFSGSTGTGPGWFQMQGNQIAHKIVNGEVFTFNFDKNLTWTDHVPLTAYDFNYSLYAWDVSLPPSLPDSVTPLSATGTGAPGMWATYISPNNPYQIQVYFNSTSVWNLVTVDVNVLPYHIFKYFNIDQIATGTGAMDTTLPFALATASSYCGSPCTYLPKGGTVPTWLQYLPNLEVGSGPFWLRAFDSTSGAGELDKNVNYFKSAWAATAPSVLEGTNYQYSENIQEFIYNAGSTSISGVNPGVTGAVAVNNATGTVTMYSPSGSVVQTYTLPAGSKGFYTIPISTTGLAPGTYELLTNATYNFFGLQRTWFEADGLTVTSPTTVTSTTTSTSVSTATSLSTTTSTSVSTATSVSTTTSTSVSTSVTTTTSPTSSYTYYYIGAIVVLIIAVIAVALVRRRPAT